MCRNAWSVHQQKRSLHWLHSTSQPILLIRICSVRCRRSGTKKSAFTFQTCFPSLKVQVRVFTSAFVRSWARNTLQFRNRTIAADLSAQCFFAAVAAGNMRMNILGMICSIMHRLFCCIQMVRGANSFMVLFRSYSPLSTLFARTLAANGCFSPPYMS